MKSAALYISVVAAMLIAGCEKCHTCVVKDNDGVHRYRYPEECGKKKELNAYADRCETEYGKYGYTCSCGETQ